MLSFNCQGLSNLFGLLAVRLNELETALILTHKQQQHNYSEVNGLSFWVFMVFGCYQIPRTATFSLVKNLYWHFTGITRKKGF